MTSRRVSVLAALLAIACGGLQAAPIQFKGYVFDASVLNSSGLRYREYHESGKLMLKVRPEEEFSIVLRNPLPVRAAVALSIDGLNTIDGKRSSPRQARKWMIEPHASIAITGWQTGTQTARKFIFTSQDGSYAEWRENREGKPYSKNLGVIGAAWFWNQEELNLALHPPQPFADEAIASSRATKKSESGSAAPSAAGGEGRAGTGMGHVEYNPVTQVEFNANDGMFSLNDVLKIYYEFAKEPAEPMPFVGEEEEGARFAPEMGR